MTTHPPPLPEVERYTYTALSDYAARLHAVGDVGNEASHGDEFVSASTFDAHVAALKEAVRVLRVALRELRGAEQYDDVNGRVYAARDAADKALADTEKWGSK